MRVQTDAVGIGLGRPDLPRPIIVLPTAALLGNRLNARAVRACAVHRPAAAIHPPPSREHNITPTTSTPSVILSQDILTTRGRTPRGIFRFQSISGRSSGLTCG